MNAVLEWARARGAKDRVEIMWAVRSLEDRLGDPGYHETRLDHIYNWVRLDLEQSLIEHQKKAYER